MKSKDPMNTSVKTLFIELELKLEPNATTGIVHSQNLFLNHPWRLELMVILLLFVKFRRHSLGLHREQKDIFLCLNREPLFFFLAGHQIIGLQENDKNKQKMFLYIFCFCLRVLLNINSRYARKRCSGVQRRAQSDHICP